MLLLGEYGTYMTIQAIFRPWLSGKRLLNLLRCSILDVPDEHRLFTRGMAFRSRMISPSN